MAHHMDGGARSAYATHADRSLHLFGAKVVHSAGAVS